MPICFKSDFQPHLCNKKVIALRLLVRLKKKYLYRCAYFLVLSIDNYYYYTSHKLPM